MLHVARSYHSAWSPRHCGTEASSKLSSACVSAEGQRTGHCRAPQRPNSAVAKLGERIGRQENLFRPLNPERFLSFLFVKVSAAPSTSSVEGQGAIQHVPAGLYVALRLDPLLSPSACHLYTTSLPFSAPPLKLPGASMSFRALVEFPSSLKPYRCTRCRSAWSLSDSCNGSARGGSFGWRPTCCAITRA